MVEYTDWTKIAFDLAADDVPPQNVISRAALLWRNNTAKLKQMSMAEARQFGRQTL